jgi:hypothetical protein
VLETPELAERLMELLRPKVQEQKL